MCDVDTHHQQHHIRQASACVHHRALTLVGNTKTKNKNENQKEKERKEERRRKKKRSIYYLWEPFAWAERAAFCLIRSSIVGRKWRMRPWTGQAAASPRAQMEWPSI